MIFSFRKKEQQGNQYITTSQHNSSFQDFIQALFNQKQKKNIFCLTILERAVNDLDGHDMNLQLNYAIKLTLCLIVYIDNQFLTITMKIKGITTMLAQKAKLVFKKDPPKSNLAYQPTPYLSHPFLQSVYNISESSVPYQFKRQKLFFDDGGHISLDWSTKESMGENPPILFVMHGLTGGSQMNYIKQLIKPATEEGYCCVCLNSRGINNEMTSPMPFMGLEYDELEAALMKVSSRYPESEIYLVGTSFGGNYLMRYLMRKKVSAKIKGLVALAPPINVSEVVDQMGSVYQKFFVKRYIEETVTKHPQMLHWERIGLVDMKKVKNSQNLREFHNNISAKILGLPSCEDMFRQYTISPTQLQHLNFPTYIMLSKDDPIVSYKTMPFQSFKNNSNIELTATEKGGHLCWFEGIVPKRWYPRPVLNYLAKLRTRGL